MGGGHELTSPDAGYAPDHAAVQYDGAVQLAESIRLFEDAVWYLEAAATPEEILVNACAVLSYAHALLGGEYHDLLGAECQAWQQLDPAGTGVDGFLAARDQLVRDAWQLDGLARAWLDHPIDPHTLRAQAYECLGGFSTCATTARQTFHP